MKRTAEAQNVEEIAEQEATDGSDGLESISEAAPRVAKRAALDESQGMTGLPTRH